jgi:hypothetical protein
LRNVQGEGWFLRVLATDFAVARHEQPARTIATGKEVRRFHRPTPEGTRHISENRVSECSERVDTEKLIQRGQPGFRDQRPPRPPTDRLRPRGPHLHRTSRSTWLGCALSALRLGTHQPKLNPIGAFPATSPSSSWPGESEGPSRTPRHGRWIPAELPASRWCDRASVPLLRCPPLSLLGGTGRRSSGLATQALGRSSSKIGRRRWPRSRLSLPSQVRSGLVAQQPASALRAQPPLGRVARGSGWMSNEVEPTAPTLCHWVGVCIGFCDRFEQLWCDHKRSC